jgi:electron transport complex, RnfABCDGE type, D subunit
MKTVSSSPHVHGRLTTPKAMRYVTYALLPSALWGVYSFGLSALVVLLVSIGSALLVEYLLGRFSHESTLRDGSALVTGLLIGMNMPPAVPLFVPILASAFAIFVVKWTFGGLGANWMNPALAGRVFVFFSFTTLMSSFTLPRALRAGAVSSASILSSLKTTLAAGGRGASAALLSESGVPLTDFAVKLGSSLNINPYAVDAFFGNCAGCIGEVSALLLLAGGIFLIVKKVITWHIPVIYLGSFALLNWMFGGIPAGNGIFGGEILLPLFSGGLMLGAIFMATDWVTTPTTVKGQIIFAIGCGFFTFLIRNFGSLPEGTSLAIILMNIVSPTIDRYIKPKKFGAVKPVKEKSK